MLNVNDIDIDTFQTPENASLKMHRFKNVFVCIMMYTALE